MRNALSSLSEGLTTLEDAIADARSVFAEYRAQAEEDRAQQEAQREKDRAQQEEGVRRAEEVLSVVETREFVNVYVGKRKEKANAMPWTSFYGWDWRHPRFQLTTEEYYALVEEVRRLIVERSAS